MVIVLFFKSLDDILNKHLSKINDSEAIFSGDMAGAITVGHNGMLRDVEPSLTFQLNNYNKRKEILNKIEEVLKNKDYTINKDRTDKYLIIAYKLRYKQLNVYLTEAAGPLIFKAFGDAPYEEIMFIVAPHLKY